MPQDRADHRRRGRARVPAAQDRHRPTRVHARARQRARELLRRRRRRRPLQRRRSTAARTSPTADAAGGTSAYNLMKYDMVAALVRGHGEPGATSSTARGRRCRTTPTRAGACSRRTGTTTGSSTGPRRGRPSRTSTTRPTWRTRSPRHRHHLPEGRGAGAVAGQRRRLDGVRRAGDPRRAAHHRHRGHGRQWIYSDQPAVGSVPGCDDADSRGAACGRVVLSDIHVSTGGGSMTEDDSSPASPIPTAAHHGPVAAGEDAGVHALRPVVVRGDHRIVIGKSANRQIGKSANRIVIGWR